MYRITEVAYDCANLRNTELGMCRQLDFFLTSTGETKPEKIRYIIRFMLIGRKVHY